MILSSVIEMSHRSFPIVLPCHQASHIYFISLGSLVQLRRIASLLLGQQWENSGRTLMVHILDINLMSKRVYSWLSAGYASNWQVCSPPPLATIAIICAFHDIQHTKLVINDRLISHVPKCS